ncbi:MAG: CGGC domain-containing protein [Sedimentisphaerales bacterium]|nr:CGGC domain-containing protein [Sedimentisphaerales bacterium]
MIDLRKKKYIVVLQCHIVKERCPGYLCEKAFHERAGGFAPYPKDQSYRLLTMTCGGCCGRAAHRKLTQMLRTMKKKEGIGKEQVVVQLSSCIAKDNFHAPPCPHLDYLKSLLARIGLDVCEDTVISEKSERRRAGGRWAHE